MDDANKSRDELVAELTDLRQGEATPQAHADDLRNLAEIGRIISASLDIEVIYPQFAVVVQRLLPFDRIGIALIDDTQTHATVAYIAGIDVEGRRLGDRFPLSGSITALVARAGTGQLIQVGDEETLTRQVPELLTQWQAGMRSFLALPLVVHDQVIGVLYLHSTRPHAYTADDVYLAESISSQIAGAIANAQHYRNRQQTEAALRDSEERYRRLVEWFPEAIFVHGGNNLIYSNAAGATLVGAASAADLVSHPIKTLIHPDDWPIVRERLLTVLHTRCRIGPIELRVLHAKGHYIDVEVSAAAITYEGRPAVQAVARDITERKRAENDRQRLEANLRQSQKMEAIGTLAGGIAHEFNNILAVMIGYTEMATFDLPPTHPVFLNLQEVFTAGRRAKDLVQQILTFSRPSNLERQAVPVSRLVQEGLKWLRATLPTTIEIHLHLAEEAGTVLADPTQLHQILMNLGSNVEYALRETGGIMEISVDLIEVDSSFTTHHPDLQPGPHVRLCIHDTGPGMPPDVVEHVFEPFFTTKGVGEGTGMGLAIVHGIVTSYDGAMTVESRPGAGTTFSIYLPRIADAMASDPTPPEAGIPQGTGRILFVDDEELLARIGQQMLERLGYEVVSHTSAIEALAAFQAAPQRFDLVITDQTMPHMTGDRLARELRRLRPDIPIILCTGFSHVIDATKAQAMGLDAFCMKPLMARDLAVTTQQVLDQRSK